MLRVWSANWALFVGMLLLMVGNGLQASLIGVRGPTAGFSDIEISAVMSAYFAGFLISSNVTPRLIRRVGHVRVFAALGSFVSAALILFPAIEHPLAWALLRAVIGFCFCGVYITAESWLNAATTSSNRGMALSVYMFVQMGGIVAAQILLNLPDASGYLLFIIPSVLVSLSFAPILLTASSAPTFGSTKSMSLPALYRASPLGVVAMFFIGGIFSAQFGMSALYATRAGLSAGELSGFVAAFYIGALVMQIPIGWLSDRMDRRWLILGAAAGGAGAAAFALASGGAFPALVASAFVMGGFANPLYSLVIAYVNDAVEYEDMPAASGGLLFVNGVGAILGPVSLGALMRGFGPSGFWLFCAGLFGAMALFALYRMAQRPVQVTGESVAFTPVFQTGSKVAAEAVAEWQEQAAEEAAGRGGAKPRGRLRGWDGEHRGEETMAETVDAGPREGAAGSGDGERGPGDVLAHWLEEVGPEGWYAVDEARDAAIRDRFEGAWSAGRARRAHGLDHRRRGGARLRPADRPAPAQHVARAGARLRHRPSRARHREVGAGPRLGSGDRGALAAVLLPAADALRMPAGSGALRALDADADARDRRGQPAPRQGAPRGDPPLRPLPSSQRGPRAHGHRPRGRVPRRRRLRRRPASD